MTETLFWGINLSINELCIFKMLIIFIVRPLDYVVRFLLHGPQMANEVFPSVSYRQLIF